jgi:hypothetical protein
MHTASRARVCVVLVDEPRDGAPTTTITTTINSITHAINIAKV